MARNLHVGTMGWSYDFWKGSFYPEKLSSNEFLTYYASKIGTVEVDSTFYRIPREQTMLSWKEQTPKDFVFSLKFPQVITHVKMLMNAEDETRFFLERAELLEEKLGPLLLQFPFSFGAKNMPFLEKFLRRLPKTHRYVVEVRNNKLLDNVFYSLLKANNVALAWVDSATMPLVTEVASDFLYVRWEGDRKTVNGTLGKTEFNRADDTKAWAEKLKPFLDGGIEVFGYFSKYYSGNPTLDIQNFLRSLDAEK
jgi:uncharacterized protein YecE (DUF72 family)